MLPRTAFIPLTVIAISTTFINVLLFRCQQKAERLSYHVVYIKLCRSDKACGSYKFLSLWPLLLMRTMKQTSTASEEGSVLRGKRGPCYSFNQEKRAEICSSKKGSHFRDSSLWSIATDSHEPAIARRVVRFSLAIDYRRPTAHVWLICCYSYMFLCKITQSVITPAWYRGIRRRRRSRARSKEQVDTKKNKQEYTS